jgi:hypothetical protein
MQAQSAAAASSGVIRVPKLPVGAEASSSAAAAEAIVDARIAAGSMDEMDDEFRQRIKDAAKAAGVPYKSPSSSRSGSPSSQTSSSSAQQQQPQQPKQQQPPKQQQQPQQGDKNTIVPWGEFFKSPPVWAVTVAHFCFNWGYYTLLAWLPSYFEMALGLNVQESSFLTLIPYVAMIAMTPVVSFGGRGGGLFLQDSAHTMLAGQHKAHMLLAKQLAGQCMAHTSLAKQLAGKCVSLTLLTGQLAGLCVVLTLLAGQHGAHTFILDHVHNDANKHIQET